MSRIEDEVKDIRGERDELTPVRLLMLALASAVVTANAYYIHPIIARVAADFDISAAAIGAVPALNQMALALGIFLLLPLGDQVSNKRLVTVLVTCQFLSIAIMAFSQSYILFVVGSTILGFFTIAPYLLPAYASKRVAPERLGLVTATLTTGVIGGILVARAGSGIIAEHFGWRAVYFVATVLMLIVSLVLPLIMDEREDRPEGGRQKYSRLVLSVIPLIRRHPEILVSGTIQGLSFGSFMAVWMGLGLHLTSEQMGYGVDVVGYLAAFSVIGLLSTPHLGAYADRIGARRARLLYGSMQLASTVLFLLFGYNLWLLMVPIALTNVFGPSIDVAGRMTVLSQAPDIRTRLMTVYIVLMFIGGGIGSWGGTAAYGIAGWLGSAGLAVTMIAGVLALSWFAWKRFPDPARD